MGESAEAKEGWRSKDPFELYLSGDRVAVLCQCYESGKDAKGNWQDREYTAVDLYDVSDPYVPKEIAYFIPPNPEKLCFDVPMNNKPLGTAEDLVVDDRGCIYLNAMHDGVYILRCTV